MDVASVSPHLPHFSLEWCQMPIFVISQTVNTEFIASSNPETQSEDSTYEMQLFRNGVEQSETNQAILQSGIMGDSM
jgi:hypothetical protein